jgi:DNA-binding HxlR family transcriptional regulator
LKASFGAWRSARTVPSSVSTATRPRGEHPAQSGAGEAGEDQVLPVQVDGDADAGQDPFLAVGRPDGTAEIGPGADRRGIAPALQAAVGLQHEVEQFRHGRPSVERRAGEDPEQLESALWTQPVSHLLGLSRRLSLTGMVQRQADVRGPLQDAATARVHPTENCSIARTLEILGEKWTFLVLRDAFRGVRRFEDFIGRTGVPRQVLSNRLATLTERGILSKQTYREPGVRPRAEYVLTPKGVEVYPILVAMRQWGDRYEADPAGAPLVMLHRDCGAEVSAHLRCADGHAVPSAREVVHSPGPGIRPAGTPASQQ